MSGQALSLRYRNSDLLAVPAVHYRHEFASMVNGLCFGTVKPPAAIAVELGPGIARAAELWLRELTMDNDGQKTLPVMLGLLRRNRFIRASLQDKALRLQRQTGMDLSELPLETLHRELDFASWELLCFSPTDSIIEAVRCALQLNIPLYGVDLEESAGGDYQSLLIRDPAAARSDFPAYIAQMPPTQIKDAMKTRIYGVKRPWPLASKLS